MPCNALWVTMTNGTFCALAGSRPKLGVGAARIVQPGIVAVHFDQVYRGVDSDSTTMSSTYATDEASAGGFAIL